MDSSFSALWQRIGDRRHTLVVGAPPPAVPPSVAAHVVRVSCDDRDRPLAPVVDLARRIEARLNLEPSGPASGLPYPLRDRLRGEPRPRGPAVRALEALQALGSAGRCTVIFEHLERADVATLRLLRLLLWRPELKNVPFVLHFADRPGDDDGAAFFGALLDTLGPEGVVRAAASPETRFVGAADVLTILRAAALLGPVADVALVAAVV